MMYTFQFMDGTWRISTETNSKFVRPIRGEALALYDAAYACRGDAERAIARIIPYLTEAKLLSCSPVGLPK